MVDSWEWQHFGEVVSRGVGRSGDRALGSELRGDESCMQTLGSAWGGYHPGWDMLCECLLCQYRKIMVEIIGSYSMNEG